MIKGGTLNEKYRHLDNNNNGVHFNSIMAEYGKVSLFDLYKLLGGRTLAFGQLESPPYDVIHIFV